jgi:hypothetical protein
MNCLLCKSILFDGKCIKCQPTWYSWVGSSIKCNKCGKVFVELFDWSGCSRCRHVSAGKRSSLKGKTFEREIVNSFKANGIEAKRGWWQTGLHSSLSRAKARIKTHTPDVLVPHLWVECSTGVTSNLGTIKLQEAINYVKDYTERTKKYLFPVSIVRPKCARSISVTMRYVDFMLLNRMEGFFEFNVVIDFDALCKLLIAYMGNAGEEKDMWNEGDSGGQGD